MIRRLLAWLRRDRLYPNHGPRGVCTIAGCPLHGDTDVRG